MKAVRLKISGKVQGVFFRESTKQRARELGVSGWVKNLPDGTVEALAQGDDKAVEQLIAYVHHGPPAARVTSVSVNDEPVGADLGPFVVER